MNSKRGSRGGSDFRGAFLAVVALVAVFSAAVGLSGKSREPPADPLGGIRHACREFISRTLHDPGSADFGDYGSWPAFVNVDGSFSVSAQYRAKNGFGAMRIGNTDCIVRKEGPNIRLVSLT